MAHEARATDGCKRALASGVKRSLKSSSKPGATNWRIRLPGEPEHDVGRRAGQPVADRLLVALVVVDVELDLEVGILALEALDHRLPRRARGRVGVVGIDDEQGREGAPVDSGEQPQPQAVTMRWRSIGGIYAHR